MAAREIGSPKSRAEKPNNRKTVRMSATHQRLAIRQASAAIASSSARQTSCTGVSTGSAAGAFLAAADGGFRLTHTQHHSIEDHKQQRPRICPGPSMPADQDLLQRSVDRGELRVQVGAEAIDDRDDRERDARSNQAVLDGGGAQLVLHETRNQVLHKLNSMYTWLVELGSGLTGVLSTVTMAPP